MEYVRADIYPKQLLYKARNLLLVKFKCSFDSEARKVFMHPLASCGREIMSLINLPGLRVTAVFFENNILQEF